MVRIRIIQIMRTCFQVMVNGSAMAAVPAAGDFVYCLFPERLLYTILVKAL